jgi:hypothetical protein
VGCYVLLRDCFIMLLLCHLGAYLAVAPAAAAAGCLRSHGVQGPTVRLTTFICAETHCSVSLSGLVLSSAQGWSLSCGTSTCSRTLAALLVMPAVLKACPNAGSPREQRRVQMAEGMQVVLSGSASTLADLLPCDVTRDSAGHIAAPLQLLLHLVLPVAHDMRPRSSKTKTQADPRSAVKKLQAVARVHRPSLCVRSSCCLLQLLRALLVLLSRTNAATYQRYAIVFLWRLGFA